MKRHMLSAVVALWTAVALVGCGPDQAPVEEAAAPPAEESRILDRAVEAAKDASERAAEAATAAKNAATEAAVSAAEQAGALRDRAENEAREMIAQVKTFLAEDQEPMARELMETLSAMKDSLSAALRAEIERLEAMFPDA